MPIETQDIFNMRVLKLQKPQYHPIFKKKLAVIMWKQIKNLMGVVAAVCACAGFVFIIILMLFGPDLIKDFQVYLRYVAQFTVAFLLLAALAFWEN